MTYQIPRFFFFEGLAVAVQNNKNIPYTLNNRVCDKVENFMLNPLLGHRTIIVIENKSLYFMGVYDMNVKLEAKSNFLHDMLILNFHHTI